MPVTLPSGMSRRLEKTEKVGSVSDQLSDGEVEVARRPLLSSSQVFILNGRSNNMVRKYTPSKDGKVRANLQMPLRLTAKEIEKKQASGSRR
jgi:hypothetical protein